jgi:hypothetical protein
MTAPEAAAHCQQEALFTRVTVPHSDHSIAAVVKSFSPLRSSYQFSKNKSQNGDRLIEHLTLSNHTVSVVFKNGSVPKLPRPNIDIITSIVSPWGALGALIVWFFSCSAPPYKMDSSLTVGSWSGFFESVSVWGKGLTKRVVCLFAPSTLLILPHFSLLVLDDLVSASQTVVFCGGLHFVTLRILPTMHHEG